MAQANQIQVKFSLLNSGNIRSFERFLQSSGRFRLVDMPVTFGLIEHPVHGVGLFDTGMTARFNYLTQGLQPRRLYRLVTPMKFNPEWSPVNQLRKRGIEPEQVDWIVLSHFDYDHICGLPDFPRARIFCHDEGWRAVRGKTGWDAVKVRVLPEMLPWNMAARIEPIAHFSTPLLDELPPGHDLFGDGSVVLVPLLGHAAGHIGALLATDQGPVLLVGDACWNLEGLRNGDSTPHQMIAWNREDQHQTSVLLQKLIEQRPDLPVIPTHCIEAWTRWGQL
ncbi:MAG: MBL fold metallo-hydrolase [Deltaproteobacteria bacterium]|nr:MBL fold metallo-hydrolase [Deltaproteobacteria bacterium]